MGVYEKLMQPNSLVISGALQPLEKDFALSVHQKEWVVGSTTMGAVIGGFLAGLVTYR